MTITMVCQRPDTSVVPGGFAPLSGPTTKSRDGWVNLGDWDKVDELFRPPSRFDSLIDQKIPSLNNEVLIVFEMPVPDGLTSAQIEEVKLTFLY